MCTAATNFSLFMYILESYARNVGPIHNKGRVMKQYNGGAWLECQSLHCVSGFMLSDLWARYNEATTYINLPNTVALGLS